MQLQHQKITLDVNDTRAYTVLNAHQGDSKTRFIDITLTDGGNAITLSSNYVATVKASINSKTKAVNTAVVNTTNNIVTVELTKTMLDTPGLLNCEVILQDNQQFVTSATFTVKVAESVISDESEIVASQEFGKLLDALIEIKDIEDKAERVQTLVNNIDKLKSADDIINRLSTSETNIETNKASIKELSDLVQEVKNSAIAEIESLKANKLDKTDFNSYKTSNDNAVNSKVDTIEFNTYKTATEKADKDNADSIKLLDTNKANLMSSKNLFDMIAYLKLLSTIANSVTKGTLDSYNDNSFTITSNDRDCYTNFWTNAENNKFTIVVEPNTTYTLSWDCEGSSGNVFVFSNATTSKMWQVVNSKKQLIFTTDNDTTFVTVRFGVANANQTATYSNIQIELGEVATDYMPCKVATGVKELDNKVDKLQDFNNDKFNAVAEEMINNSIINTTDKASNIVITDSSNYNIVSLVADKDDYNISLYSKNLLNSKEFAKLLHTNAYVTQGSVTIDNNTISYDMTQGNYCGIYFRYNEFVKDNVLIDKSCVISLTVTVDKSCTFRLLDENSNKFVSKVLESDTKTQISLPITLNKLSKSITFYGKNITETTHIKLSNIMIELGSVNTEYEDYKDMQSVTQETDLSTVHTYYPTTTVVADSDVQLTYVADSKNYIDNKFNELATALVAHESEVN